MKITFRQVEDSDLQQIKKWIKYNKFVKRWYYKNILPQLTTLYKRIIERRSVPKFFSNLILIDEVPIGYIQSYAIEGWGAWSNKTKIYDNTVGLDYFIGDLNYIHKGYGPKIIQKYIDEQKKLGYEYVSISPDPDNIVNCKCCEKCGLTFQKIVNVPYKNSKNKEAIYIKKL